MIINIVLTAIFLVMVGFCILFGIRKGFIKSAFGLCFNLITAIISILIAKVAALSADNIAVKFITKRLQNHFRGSGTEVFETAAFQDALTMAGTFILACGIFVVLYITFYFIFKIPISAINKAIMAHSSKNLYKKPVFKILAPILCVISGIITFVVFTAPAANLLTIVDASADETDVYKLYDRTDIIDEAASYPLIKIIDAVSSDNIFGSLTDITTTSVNAELDNELHNVSLFMFSVMDCVDEDNPSDNTVDMENMQEAFEDSVFLPEITADVASTAARCFLDGKDFLGYKFTIPSGLAGTIFTKGFEIISEWDAETVTEGFSTLIDLLIFMREYELTGNVSKETMINAFRSQEFFEEITLTLFSSEVFKDLIPDVEYTAINLICEEMGLEIPVRLSEVSIDSLNVDDVIAEAQIITDVVKSIYEVQQEAGTHSFSNMTSEQQKKLHDAINSIEESSFFTR